MTLFQTWHAEAVPTERAAVEGAERLALGAAMAGAEAAARAGESGVEAADESGAAPLAGAAPFAVVVAPAASAGSRGLEQALHEHRGRLTGKAAYWIRIAPSAAGGPELEGSEAPRRRRVFLGARGRVVIALRGGEGNPYRVRDTVVGELRNEAYGPRPLDFELIRKLAQQPAAIDLIGAAPSEPPRSNGAPATLGVEATEERLRRSLFDPVGEIVIPAVPHPDRPRAWLTFEIAEAMEAESIASRVRDLSGGGSAEIVERFPWDRANIHHPAIHALIGLSKTRSAGAEIWPSAPWPTPSGLFSKALGLGLAEWGIPLPPGAAIRFPKPEEFEAIALEIAELLLGVSSEPS